MIFSKSDFSTVLIVGKNQSETKSVRIRTKHLNRLKQYAFSIVFVLLALSGTIVFLSMKIADNKAERLVYDKQIAELERKLAPAPGISQEQLYIEEIEGKLQKINQYLLKRGIPGFSAKDIGGAVSNPDLTPEETYALYNERLESILVGVAFTPMGYPSNFLVTSGFGYRSDPMRRGGMEFHSGIDFKGRKGDTVKSTADGKVIHAGWFQGYGYCVRIQHNGDLETLYGHLSKITVKKGQVISAGQVVGKVGSTGRSTGNHLHYEVRKNDKPINPRSFLSIN